MIGYNDYKEYLKIFSDLYLEKEKDNVISLVLYGSVARGVAGLLSDIDILIVLKTASPHYYERLKPFLQAQKELRKADIYKSLVSKGYQAYISVIILTLEEAKENRCLYLDMIEDAKILYDNNNFFKEKLNALKNSLCQLGSEKVKLGNNTWYWRLKPDLKLGEVIKL